MKSGTHFFPMISSGAAYASEPHRVERRGEAGEMNRESPKSVNLSIGVGRLASSFDGSEQGNGLAVNKISGNRRASAERQQQSGEGKVKRTF